MPEDRFGGENLVEPAEMARDALAFVDEKGDIARGEVEYAPIEGPTNREGELGGHIGPFLREAMREEIRSLLDHYAAQAGAVHQAAGAPVGNVVGHHGMSRDGRHQAVNGWNMEQVHGAGRWMPPEGFMPLAHRRQGGGAGDFSPGRHVWEDLSIKVKPFDPAIIDWYAYRQQFLSIAAEAGWTDRVKVLKLLGALQNSVPGVTVGLVSPIHFEALLHRVDGIYGLTNMEYDAALKLQGLKMDPTKDTVALFAEKVRQLCMRAYPTYTEADREKQMLCHFLQGLHERNDFRYQMRLREFDSLAEAVRYGTRLEQIILAERGDGREPAIRAVQSSQLTLETLVDEFRMWREEQKVMMKRVDFILCVMQQAAQQWQMAMGSRERAMGHRRGGSIECWNCHRPGHISRDCRLPSKVGLGGLGRGWPCPKGRQVLPSSK